MLIKGTSAQSERHDEPHEEVMTSACPVRASFPADRPRFMTGPDSPVESGISLATSVPVPATSACDVIVLTSHPWIKVLNYLALFTRRQRRIFTSLAAYMYGEGTNVNGNRISG